MRQSGPYDPPVGRHLNPIALPYVGNDVGREWSPLDALKSPLFHNETLSPFRGVTQVPTLMRQSGPRINSNGDLGSQLFQPPKSI